MMFYLILSWSDIVEQMITQYDTQDHMHCPLCGEQLSIDHVTHAVKHAKTCYVERRVRNALFHNKHMCTRDRMEHVLDVVEQVDQEINKYLNEFSFEHHSFLE